jgi:hypothetical protein
MHSFIQKTQVGGWMSLGGILLCVTGKQTRYSLAIACHTSTPPLHTNDDDALTLQNCWNS